MLVNGFNLFMYESYSPYRHISYLHIKEIVLMLGFYKFLV